MTTLTPSCPEQVADELRRASGTGTPVDIVGGGTRSRRGMPGPRAGHDLHTAGLDRVVAHEPADLTLTVEAGIPMTELARVAASAGQCWPQGEVRPGSTLGGVLAAAASGRERLRAGAVRDSLLEVVIVTGDGRLVTAGGRTVKGVSGYDIPRLTVGALGTLGVIVQATIKLWPMPPARAWFGAEGPLEARVAAAQALLAGPVRPATVLLTPGRVAVQLTGPPEDVVAPAGFVPRDSAPAAPSGVGLMEAGVAPPRLGELARALEEQGLDYEARMGVGTVLVAVADDDQIRGVRAAAAALGGHAVVTDAPDGLLTDPWGPPPPGLHLMKRLREAFDPAGILNRRLLLWA